MRLLQLLINRASCIIDGQKQSMLISFKYLGVVCSTLLFTCSVMASFNVYEFSDTGKEMRFQHLIESLRCPKCQNNNLADSNAPLATDIKNYVYDSVKAGKSDNDITDFLISRYGIFIIYDPKIIWIWLIPTLVIGVGVIMALRYINTTRRQTAVPDNLPSMSSLIAIHEQNKRNQRERR